jgi:hypothetical protein
VTPGGKEALVGAIVHGAAGNPAIELDPLA